MSAPGDIVSAPTNTSETPLFEASSARVTVDDGVAFPSLTFRAAGRLVVIAGETAALFALLTSVPLAAARALEGPMLGEARIAAGSMFIAGRSVADGAHSAIVGAASLDPPLPPWTVREHVTWSARLAGLPKRAAAELAHHALTRAGLAAAAARATHSLVLAERRALAIAQALVARPEVLVLEGPLSALDGAQASFVDGVLRHVLADHTAIVGVSRLDPGTPEGVLARAATDLLVLRGGELIYAGAPGDVLHEAKLVALTVRSQGEALQLALSEKGVEMRGGPTRWVVALREGQSTQDIMTASAAVKAPVIEMFPVVG